MRNKENKYVCIRKELLYKFLKDYNLIDFNSCDKKETSLYRSSNNELSVEDYKNGLIIVNSLYEIKAKFLVDVSENKIYNDDNINNLVINNIIIEGTDGVGKTSTIVGLINMGIICTDRNEEICKYMLFDVDIETRCKAYKKYLENNAYKIIFLINNSREELEKRINMREKVSEFDKLAYEYNTLYKDTYIAMQKYDVSDKLAMIDCTNLSLEEQINKVKKYILEE